MRARHRPERPRRHPQGARCPAVRGCALHAPQPRAGGTRRPRTPRASPLGGRAHRVRDRVGGFASPMHCITDQADRDTAIWSRGGHPDHRPSRPGEASSQAQDPQGEVLELEATESSRDGAARRAHHRSSSGRGRGGAPPRRERGRRGGAGGRGTSCSPPCRRRCRSRSSRTQGRKGRPPRDVRPVFRNDGDDPPERLAVEVLDLGRRGALDADAVGGAIERMERGRGDGMAFLSRRLADQDALRPDVTRAETNQSLPGAPDFGPSKVGWLASRRTGRRPTRTGTGDGEDQGGDAARRRDVHATRVPRETSSSAICTVLSAAPFRRLSPTTKKFRTWSSNGSARTRPTATSSRPA